MVLVCVVLFLLTAGRKLEREPDYMKKNGIIAGARVYPADFPYKQRDRKVRSSFWERDLRDVYCVAVEA